jgi:hypothetical protein
MNKFIFLDIDGVMNSNLFYSERTQDKRLNRITDATKAKIVVSSTWRSDSNLQEVFTLVGIKEPIYDVTPYMRSRHRGSEIQEWLDKQTDWLKWGLSDEDVEQAIHILNDTAA